MKLIYILICASIIFSTFSCEKNDDSTNPTETLDQNIQFPNISQNTKWFIGDTVMIAWNTNGLTGVVTLSLFKGDIEIAKIISNENCTSSNNEREYVLPTNVIPGTDYRIKVNYSSTHLNYSPYFEIKYGKIEILEPNENSIWFIGERYGIKWKHAYLGGSVKIVLYRWDWDSNDYVVSQTITNSTNNNGNFNFFNISSNVIASPYEVGITWNGGGNEVRSDLFDITKKIIVSMPDSSTVWNRGGTYQINWGPSLPLESEMQITLVNEQGTEGQGIVGIGFSGNNTSLTTTIPTWITPGRWRIELFCTKVAGGIAYGLVYGLGNSDYFYIQ